MPLTDAAIRASKAPPTLTKLSDGGGLQLWLTPEGSKLWRLAYRFAGKQKKLSIGPYPAVTLAAARERRDEAKRLLAAGTDPGQQKRIDKIARANNAAASFKAVAAELLEKKERERKAAGTLAQIARALCIANTALAERPISAITSAEILAMLKRVEASGRLETAKRVRARVGEVFRYAISTGRAETDPTFALRGALTAPKVTHRAALTTPSDLGGLLRAIDGFKGQASTVAALKLLAYLFPRPGELRLARWDEFDLDAAVWNIPPYRMKMRRPHRVPLPPHAIAILNDLRALTGVRPFVFTGYGMSGGEGRKVAPALCRKTR